MSTRIDARPKLRRPAQLTFSDQPLRSKPERIPSRSMCYSPASPINAGYLTHTVHTEHHAKIHGSPESGSPLRAPIRFIVSDAKTTLNVGRQPPTTLGPWRPQKIFTRFIKCNPLNMAAVHPGDEVYFCSVVAQQTAMANAYIAQRLTKAMVFAYDEDTGNWTTVKPAQ